MLAACETGEVFALLEARDTVDNFAALYNSVREPWLTRALLLYHARTGSTRALELLARAPDAHVQHLLDALLEQLRGERPARLHALAALAPLVARRPLWLHRLPHSLARDLLRAARHERDPLPLLHVLLTLAALLPAVPTLAAPHWPDLADALLRPSALDPPPPPPTRDHLQLAQLALFHALYATHPCTLLETLRSECATGSKRDIWERGVAPLLRSVRLHPALVTGSRQREADAARWAHLEIHDVLAESRRLSMRVRDRADERAHSAIAVPGPVAPPSPAPGCGAHATRAASALRPGAEPWFALGDRCGADSAPNTPLPADVDAAEPPEAAVEATPENTPAKETRAQFRFPTESAAVRAIGRRSQPPSPLRKETSPPAGGGPGEGYAGRLARVALERRAAESPVPFGGGPPPAGAVARPEPSRAAPATDNEPLNVEDREVLELTERARTERSWSGAEARTPVARDPRAAERGGRRAGAAAPARRSASCEARVRGARSADACVQTLDVWPAPYEFLIADFYRSLPADERKQNAEEKIDEPTLPCERLDSYLSELYSGQGVADASELGEQLALVHAQLMYERWRREAHAERNRRLLGRCRETRALELQNAALRDRLRAAHHERDELLARRARDAPAAPPAAAASERELRLEAALAEESAARLRAEAALRECEAQRAIDAAELRRTRGESFEAARHVEALARAALAAERRSEHVRRLRRELLVLAEREARLSGAVRAASGAAAGAEAERAAAEERALRAALARAEAEAEAAAARAEAATARAHELEAALGARDAAVGELRRAARHAGEEHAARLRALQDKCAALARTVRAGEGRRLEWLAGAAGARGAAAAGGGRGARPALADCSRVRRLLERDDADVAESS
ncbi:hamartin [Vanessa cardui]|uniref:hamartin n=1 Tax=Vanessa cardui TaxID=171605 RepID=UPI001F12A9D4|nr:hamartin [Vanessa cardui]